jgi:hypothetical protein
MRAAASPVIRGLRALACVALVLACAAQAPYPRRTPPPQDVRIAFATEDGKVVLRVFSSGPLSLDLGALAFTVRPYAGDHVDRNAAPQPIHVALGEAVALPGNGNLYYAYRVAAAIAPPARPGMYQLAAEPADGFARDAGGAVVHATRFPNAGIGAIGAWWPDERADDAGLRDVRARFAGRVVHGYGGMTVTCGTVTQAIGPRDGVRVGDVTRALGTVEQLRTGPLTHWGGDDGFVFLAFDPLVLSAAAAQNVGGRTVCLPRWRFADPWHVDVTLTTAEPPPLETAGDVSVRAGMSRDEVVWRAGYPNQYGTVATFRSKNVWHYDAPAPFRWSVTFAHDRVVAVKPPGNLP